MCCPTWHHRVWVCVATTSCYNKFATWLLQSLSLLLNEAKPAMSTWQRIGWSRGWQDVAPHLGDNALPPAARRTHPLLLSPRTLDPTSLVPRDPPHPILSAQDTAHNGRGIVAISQHFTLTACLHHVEDVSKPTNSSFPPPHANTLIKNHTHTHSAGSVFAGSSHCKPSMAPNPFNSKLTLSSSSSPSVHKRHGGGLGHLNERQKFFGQRAPRVANEI